MPEKRRFLQWFGCACDADQSPQLSMLRGETDDCGDLYYYRALSWCKRYAKKGQLAQWWPALAPAVRWPGTWEQLRELWRKCHVVEGSLDEIFDWFDVNGWILARANAAAKHMADKRRAGRASAKSRRERARQRRLDFHATPQPHPVQRTLPKTRAPRPQAVSEQKRDSRKDRKDGW